MTVKLLTKTVFHCTCRSCGYVWDALLKPARCSRCKSRTWNGEDLRRKDPWKNVAPDSRVATGERPPQPRPKDLLAAFLSAKAIIAELVQDNPCDHKRNLCVCAEKKALAEIDAQIANLSAITGKAASNGAAQGVQP